MRKLTKTEMKKLKAQLNEMDYNVEALSREATITAPANTDQLTVCKTAAMYGN